MLLPICGTFHHTKLLQNEAINGHYKNVEFVCADVVSPDFNFPAESFDLIFSSWLLLYLSDEEVKKHMLFITLLIFSFIYIYIYCIAKGGTSLFLQVKALAQRMLKWLKIGGHFFFRESCFRHSGDHERKNNPSYYRHPAFYNKVSSSSFSLFFLTVCFKTALLLKSLNESWEVKLIWRKKKDNKNMFLNPGFQRLSLAWWFWEFLWVLSC